MHKKIKLGLFMFIIIGVVILNFTYFYTVFFYLTTNTEYCIIITIIIMAKIWIIF